MLVLQGGTKLGRDDVRHYVRSRSMFSFSCRATADGVTVDGS